MSILKQAGNRFKNTGDGSANRGDTADNHDRDPAGNQGIFDRCRAGSGVKKGSDNTLDFSTSHR